ncbi:hypothetical protein B0H14DRAFT_2804893, partial [Mycena olivaceomarginata]
FLWDLLQAAFRLFYRRPTLLIESRPRSWKLNNDVLTEILASPQLNLKDLLEISLVSHRFRVLVTPLIFGKHTWSPWSGSRPSFPTQALWAHIRILNLRGPGRMLESSDHQSIVSQLRLAIQGLTAAHTFSFGGMGGGLWPQLLDTVAAAPALTHLIIDNMPWLGVSRGMKRPPHMLEMKSTTYVVLRACHSSLESLTLPAELILLSLDVSLEWNGLRELQLVGYWPDRAELSLYSVLLVLPNLRILSLRHQSATSGHRDPIVPADILASASEIFLPQLRQFEVATLVQEECVLSILPPGLEKLSVIVYPERSDYRYPSNIRRASEFLGMLAGVYLPAVTHLQLWYQTDASDNIFLHRLPAAFPSLRTLEIHRFMGQNMDDEWNPASVFQTLLPHWKDLRVFAIEPDYPNRRHKYLRRLRGIAEEMVLLTPWLREIRIAVQFEDDMSWETWDIVYVPGEGIRLCPRYDPEWFEPEICSILVGSSEDAESEPESE